MNEVSTYFGQEGQYMLSRALIFAAMASLILAPTMGCGPSEEEGGDEEPVIIVVGNNSKGEPGENRDEQTSPPTQNNSTTPVSSENNQSSPPMMTTPSVATTPPPSETTPPEPETSPAELVRTGPIMEISRFAAGMTGTGILHVFGVKSGLKEMVHRGYSPASGWTNEKFVLDTGGRPLINNFVCANSAYNRVLCSYRAGDIGGDRFIRYTFGYGHTC